MTLSVTQRGFCCSSTLPDQRLIWGVLFGGMTSTTGTRNPLLVERCNGKRKQVTNAMYRILHITGYVPCQRQTNLAIRRLIVFFHLFRFAIGGTVLCIDISLYRSKRIQWRITASRLFQSSSFPMSSLQRLMHPFLS